MRITSSIFYGVLLPPDLFGLDKFTTKSKIQDEVENIASSLNLYKNYFSIIQLKTCIFLVISKTKQSVVYPELQPISHNIFSEVDSLWLFDILGFFKKAELPNPDISKIKWYLAIEDTE